MQYAALNVLEGPLKGQSLPLRQREIVIGRDENCDIALPQYSRVSRRHARLRFDGKSFVVEDLGSTNGVKVEGKDVKSAVLQSGSRVQLGDFAAQLWLPAGKVQFEGDAPNAVLQTWKMAPRQTTQRAALAASALILLLLVALASTRRQPERVAVAPETNAAQTANASRDANPQSDAPREMPQDAPQSVAPSEPVNGKISASAIAAVKNATVLVVNREGNRVGFGSGFVVGDARHVVTNRHVVVGDDGQPRPCILIFNCGTAQQSKVEIEPDQIQLPPQTTDDAGFRSDLAVITLNAPVVAGLPLGQSESVTETDTVYVIGFPLGVGTLTLDNELPSASVKAVGVERVQRSRVNGPDAVTVLQLGGTVTHGNSGGPVVNARGEVVGVVSRGAEGTGMSYAIPTAFLRALL